MPYQQQLVGMLWGLGLGTGLVTAVWLVVSNAWYRQATSDRIPETDIKPGPVGTVEEYPEGLAEAHGRPTLFLKLWIVAYVLWAVGYVVIYMMERAG